MTTHYVKVPVEFGTMKIGQGVLIGAFLRTGPMTRSNIQIGYGETEEEAFANLLAVLRFEEAQ